LRHTYNDFAPKLWLILSKIGYKKFLQRIYVSIESERILKSPYYQFPILLAVVEALGLLTLTTDFITFGKLNEYNILQIPDFITKNFPTTRKIFIAPKNQTFSQAVNTLLQQENKLHNCTNNMSQALRTFLFPHVVFNNEKIDLNKTPSTVLKKIDISDYIV
jgi:hypothetical protein